MRMRPLWLALLVLAACEPSEVAPPLPAASATATLATSASAPEPELCAAAAALRKRLAPIDVLALRVNVDESLALPESKAGERPPEGVVVQFQKASFTVEGEPAPTPAAAVAAVARGSELRGERDILLAVGKDDADLARVAAVAEALAPDMSIFVLASPPGAKTEPPPAALAQDLTGVDPSERATRMAEALRGAIADCAAATKLFGTLASAHPDSRAPRLKEELPAAVHRCDCKVGAELVDLAAYLLGGDRIVVGKRLVVADEGKAVALAGMKGQALYDALPSDGEAVHLTK